MMLVSIWCGQWEPTLALVNYFDLGFREWKLNKTNAAQSVEAGEATSSLPYLPQRILRQSGKQLEQFTTCCHCRRNTEPV